MLNTYNGEIYKIWFDNDSSGKVYVGQTKRGSANRVMQHVYEAYSPHGGCPLLDEATRVFGPEHMRFEVLESRIPNPSELDEAERFWIAQYNSVKPGGYNVKRGGQGTDRTPSPDKVELSSVIKKIPWSMRRKILYALGIPRPLQELVLVLAG